MKKVIIAIGALLSFTTMKAQEDKVRFGAKGGLNFSNTVINASESSSLNVKIDIHLGVLVEIPFSDKFAVQPELMYSSQGNSILRKNNGTSLKIKRNFNYVHLPVMIKYYMLEGFTFQAGPQIGGLIRSNLESTFNGGFTETMKLEGNRYLDFAINFGLGYQLDSNWFFDTRFNLGLSNVFDSYNSNIGLVQKHRVIQASVGYKF